MNEEIQNTEINEEELANELIEESPIEELPVPGETSADETAVEEATAEEAPAEDALPSEAEETPAEDEFPSELDLAEDEIADDDELTEGTSEISEEAEDSETSQAVDSGGTPEEQITATSEELKPVIEALLFVADEPLPFKQLCKVLGEVPEEDVQAALEELVAEYEARNSGLDIREIAGGWRLSTRPQNHEFIRKYLKSRPSARLSLPALETLAVIAYKQPITIPEILEIRGVSSSSAIKTLLEKRLIVTKGRKETVGKPMLYGTSKEFLIQFGLKDLNELPSFEDFEDLAQ